MGKRKHYDDEEYIDMKIRKLERKKSKIRERRHRSRHRTYSDSSLSSRSEEHLQRYYERRDYSQDQDYSMLETDPMQEDSKCEETPLGTVFDISPGPELAIENTTTQPQHPLPAPASGVAPATASTSMQLVGPSETAVPSASEPVSELDPDILLILGEEPVREEKFGPCIQKDIASRWSDFLINGLKEDTRKEITQKYEIPENLKLAQAPVLNPEIKAACNENVLKRDNILMGKQKLLGKIITSVANTMSTLLSGNITEDATKNDMLKALSDTGRLLCHIHFSETQTRRNFILTSLSKDVKDNIKDLKRDNLLFGKDLQENLRSMKAITRTGAELRHTVVKPKPQPKNKAGEASTSRALNWRGPPTSAAPSQPRRAPAKANSASGGRRPPPRQTYDRRAPPAQPRHSGRTAHR
ncbi:uncharacterized protein LOC126369164 [Pectinophora gossypiella]|uniref:uncharacterized protein LOC126369164 n=1 Tax=Pectinophora gossypiella TaxID=13191 RepID=UPI00214E3B4E|nr:uncharacterized protein LOC126369164 [Pectinophora gossypiella]